MLIWIGVIIFLLITFLLFSYIKVELILNVRDDDSYQGISVRIDSRFYKKERNYDYSDPKLSLLESIIIATIDKKFSANNTNKATSPDNSDEELFQSIKSLIVISIFRSMVSYDMFKNVLGHIVVDKLDWKTTVGCQDAFYTAISTGLLWALKGTYIAMLSSKCRLNHIRLEVRPDFTSPAFLSNFICIFKIRIVHIIIMSMRLKFRRCMNGFTARNSSTSN